MAKAAKPGSEEGRRRILAAARSAFATHGFEGASLRAISVEAGVLHTAMLYHFPSKDVLWRAVMADLFDAVEARFADEAARLAGAPPDLLARALVRNFVSFCASCPELHRIMTIEGRSDTDRLTWLVDRYSRRLFDAVKAMAPVANPLIADPIQLYYAIIGLSASVFTLAPEYRRLSGRDPFAEAEITATADLVERLVFGPAGTGLSNADTDPT
ncbi:TetR/AcrR family transcriptional regulator [Sphingomonas sp. AR_OL41]|uniref:TetR/AcrR family transcriptional regulator n=1 Tax=Sphingomonas sp. AR_OL41 TaxID=3042729 RepID=UPI002480D3E8|nr:TetR/AcrR family transcriptional regulator [Sphingomonas sp. AR_OL41]MDH7972111.1 TetR/AcrR family transcriptional regulator [Sphingomonas sp. AR_OL41]